MSDLTIRDVQATMDANLKRWYPDAPGGNLAAVCLNKVIEECKELVRHPYAGEEMADVVIAMTSYASTLGIDLQAEIERKLAILAQRNDQPERDRERGIG